MATLSAGLRMKRFPAFSSQRSARRNSRSFIILYLQQKASIFCYACLCSTIGRKSLLKSRNLLLRQPGILRNDIDWNAGVFEILRNLAFLLRCTFTASFFTPSSLAFIIAIFLTICIGFARPDLRKFFYCDLMKQHACYLSAMFVQEIRDQALVHAHFHCRIDGLFQIAAVCA